MISEGSCNIEDYISVCWNVRFAMSYLLYLMKTNKKSLGEHKRLISKT